MKKTLLVEIYYDENIPDIGSRYTATTNDKENKHAIVVSGKDVPSCFREIATSMECFDDYSKNNVDEK